MTGDLPPFSVDCYGFNKNIVNCLYVMFDFLIENITNKRTFLPHIVLPLFTSNLLALVVIKRAPTRKIKATFYIFVSSSSSSNVWNINIFIFSLYTKYFLRGRTTKALPVPSYAFRFSATGYWRNVF